MEKMTKNEMFSLIEELCADNADVVAFCEAEKAALAKKAEKAKARAAEKRAAGDELYAAVLECVGSEPITAEAVLDMIDGEDLTVAKVRARLSQGVKNGVLAKETIKVDGKAKVHYTKAN
jgi:DNA replication initiation complex subunit (GINS family)